MPNDQLLATVTMDKRQENGKRPSDAYTDEFVLESFCKYITFYANRRRFIDSKKATWQGVAFWLRALNFYGRILIARSIITVSEFRQLKFPQANR